MEKEVVVCLFASSGLDKTAHGLVGFGRRLADASGRKLRGIIIGAHANEIAVNIARMADAVTVADQIELAEYQPETYLAALTQLCIDVSPALVLLSDGTYFQEVAPRLAYRVGGSAVGDALDVRLEGEKVFATRRVYGGKAQAVIELKRSPAVVWLRTRCFSPAVVGMATSEITRVSLALRVDFRTRIVERRQQEAEESRLEDAQIIVAGGRGVGGQDFFVKHSKPLAELLGAQMAASRAACDAGWAPVNWQVGLTGKKVAPELYLAIGISGASQHLAGVSDARTIAAINTDADAPIFSHCQFGIVGDYRQILPLLCKKLLAEPR